MLADDHAMVREGIKMVLSGREDLKVVGEADDGLHLIDLVTSLSPHMAIVDLFMPGLGGIEATEQIKILRPEVKVLILTMHRDEGFLRKALSSGAEGYLLKDDGPAELLKAIESIQKGIPYVSSLLGEGALKGSF